MTDCNGTKSSGAHSTLELRSSCFLSLSLSSCFITERLLSSRIMGGICPYQQLRCILHSPGLPRLTWPRRLASPSLARFGLIAHRTGSLYSLVLQCVLCAFLLLLSTAINFRYTYTASQNPCLTFHHHHSLFSVSALRPPSGVLISPPGSGTLVRLRLPLLVNSLF
jgi:hypothetical protein